MKINHKCGAASPGQERSLAWASAQDDGDGEALHAAKSVTPTGTTLPFRSPTENMEEPRQISSKRDRESW